MDFFERCKMCLHCLPFTSSDSPPSPPLPLSPPPSHAATAAAASQDGEKSSFSHESFSNQQLQGLPLSEPATELGFPGYSGKLNSGSATNPSGFCQEGESQGGAPSVIPEENEHHAGNASHHQHNYHLGHAYGIHHMPDNPQHSSLDTLQSVPAEMHGIHAADAKYNNAGKLSDTGLLGASQSEPITEAFEEDAVNHGPHRVRRRDQLKHQLKDLRNQIRHGGHNLKEEGSKHLREVMSNMNMQAQQLAGGGSFFISPRRNDS